MRSVSQLRSVRRGARAAVTTMMMATALLIPALASADAVHYGYVWKRDADGKWEDKANWNCINPAGGNCNPAENKGYPNLAGDEAFFDGVNYTARHTIVVNRTDIRVAKFFFGHGPGFTFQPTGLGQIILNSGLSSSPAEIVTTSGASSSLQFFVPFVNESPLVVTAELGNQIDFYTDIGPYDFGLTVQGAGLVILDHATTYTGPTVVLGKLSLQNLSPDPAVLSREVIVGNGGPGLGQLTLPFEHQLAPGTNVTVNFGWLTVLANNQISDLTVSSQSNVFVQRSASFVTRNVTMNDSAVISTGAARLVLTGDVTVGQNPGGFSSGLFGGLELSPGFRRFTVGSTLDIAGHVTGMGGLIKDGPGTLFFRDDSNGAADNTYFGDTRVAQGTVEVFATRVAVPGFLVIGQDNLAAQVILHQPALAVSTNVIVGSLGLFLSQVSFEIRGLLVSPGGRVVQDGPSNGIATTASLTMTGGDVDIRRGTISVTNVLFATSDSGQTALIHGAGSVVTPLITTADGPEAVDLRISTRLVNALVIFGDFNAKFTTKKNGPGVLELAAANDWSDMIVAGGTLRVGVAGAIPGTASLTLSDSANPATLDVNNFNLTLAALSGGEGGSLPLGATTLTVDPGEIGPAFAGIGYAGTIAGTGKLVKRGTSGSLILSGSQPNAFTGLTSVESGALVLGKSIQKGTIGGPVVITGGTLFTRTDNQFADAVTVTLNAPGALELVGSVSETIASLAGNGDVRLSTGTLILGSGRSTVFSGTMTGATALAGLTPEKYFRLIKVGLSTFTLTGAINLGDQAVVDKGVLTLDTQMNGRGVIVRNGASLAGTGRVAAVSTLSATTGGVIAPGHGNPGVLHADSADITGAFLVIQVTGTAVGTGYDQLDLTGGLALNTGARLLWQPTATVPKGSTFMIVRVTGAAPIGGLGAFSGMPEKATFTANGQTFGITYQGGDGNDIVVTALDGPAVATTATNTAMTTTTNTYFLSAGFTGSFFDEDVLIANPNDAPAPVTLTFTKDSGEQIVDTRTVAAQSRLTVHVDQIPGLESTTASVEVRSDSHVPLAVERATFWDQTHYAGHTTTAVERPAQEWFFADGAETATAHTFLWLANPNDTPTDVTLTFVRDKDVPVVTAFTMAAAAQVAVPASGFPDLADHAFGLAMHATQPILAERSLYVGTTPARASSGETTPMAGTASMGVPAASTQWYFADGATGDVFDTVFLFTNPQSTAAHVTLTYLLDGGVTITVPKTVPASGRLTTNVEAETDPRLRNASFSAILTSDVPIVAERSMHWQGDGHASAGAAAPATKWALAEGRSGGPLRFRTYLQLANPQATAASVTVTYLREDGAPADQAYTVPAMSRLTVDVAAVPGMNEASFGALVEVTNEVPIVVERSMYWNANGVAFSGGTSVVAIRLP
jgi:autotransporter-associated beta strand protein